MPRLSKTIRILFTCSNFKRSTPTLLALFLLTVSCIQPSFEAPESASYSLPNLTQADLWQQCPSLAPYPETIGDFWLQFTENARFCSEVAYGADVRSAFKEQTEVRILPGDLFLPLEKNEPTVPFLSCFAAGEHRVQPLGPASWNVKRKTTFGEDFIEATLQQPVRLGGHLAHLRGDTNNSLGVFEIRVAGTTSQMSALSIANQQPRPPPKYQLQLCGNSNCTARAVVFGSCERESGRLERYDLKFEGIELSILTITDPAQEWFTGHIAQVKGNMLGVNIDTAGAPYALAHTSYDFSYYFDLYLKLPEPINGACYAVINSLSKWGDYAWGSWISCDENNDDFTSFTGTAKYTLLDTGLEPETQPPQNTAP